MWLKRFSYSVTVKVLVIILFAVSAFFMFNSLIGISEIPEEESWYDNSVVMFQLTEKAGFVRDWIVRYSDEEIFNPDKVTKKEIENYKSNGGIAIFDKEVVENIIKDRKAYFKNIQRELIKENVNVEFLAINMKTGKVITNIKDYSEGNKDSLKEAFNKRNAFIIGNGSRILETNSMGRDIYDSYVNVNYYRGESFEEEEDYEVYVAVSGDIREGDWFYEDSQEFNRHISIKEKVYLFGGIGITLPLILLLFWICIVGQHEKGGAVKLTAFDKIPCEGHIIGYSLIMIIGLTAMRSGLSEIMPKDWLPYTFNPNYAGHEMVLFLCISLGVCITLLFASSVIKHIKNHTMQQYVMVIRAAKWLFKNLITEKTLPAAAFLAVGAYFTINLIFTGISIIMLYKGSRIMFLIVMFFILAFNLMSALGILKVVLDYLKILKGSKQIAQGDLKGKIELRGALPIMKDMAHTINHIGEGLGNAVERSLKSERLKTELITNVSHDLKTPLTSIISYIDLLKEEAIENTAAKEYIQILDERSNRLKQLVEDLVDASKAVTGNVRADLAKIELHQLARQTVGEYTDRLEANGLTVIMNKIEDVYILADGRHMHRILENLLSNVNKYAMPHTRVYIDVIRENEYGKLIIKNISKEYLNIDPSELTKRFVRGDEARSTEGSGLGLAIAQSLVKLQGGIFDNSIDGDLFKVEIKIPSC